ncbi:hypothetical protein WJX84_005760 [Apatococcus fuscideae]|uniref:Uncharacterized protein n=1 Tax=Apatococcus fuscideae TaxID=2026836 RepID=A0AAW1TF44_9CHLO
MDNMTPEKLGQLTRQGIAYTGHFFRPVLPYAVQATASAIGFSTGLGVCQAAGMVLRVSCGTPVAGPVMGMMGVGLSSALAGQASLFSQQRLAAHPSGLLRVQGPPRPLLCRQDLITDALLGVAIYKMLGGHFRSVLPQRSVQAWGFCA